MIIGPLVTRNPFDEPWLLWCETRFAVADQQVLDHAGDGAGPFRITLPPALSDAVPKRRSEFLAGRLCAAHVLRQAGLPETVGQKGRAPVWPENVAGSITHSRNRAIAALAPRHAAVGIDCEAMVSHDRAIQLCSAIFSEAEASHCPPALPFAGFFTLVFSAKEALYKALSPRLDRIPDFHEARLARLGPGVAVLRLDGTDHEVRFRLTGEDCLTLALLPPGAACGRG